jgi:hypothetical protein
MVHSFGVTLVIEDAVEAGGKCDLHFRWLRLLCSMGWQGLEKTGYITFMQ